MELTKDDVFESPPSCEVTSGDLQAAVPSSGRPVLSFDIFTS